jgi:hypothetical protein
VNSVPGGRTILVCQDCGDRTIFAAWINGSILCSVCAESDVDPVKPKHLARTWDEFRGKPRKPKSERG